MTTADKQAIEILRKTYAETDINSGHELFNAQVYLKNRQRYQAMKARLTARTAARAATREFRSPQTDVCYEGIRGSYPLAYQGLSGKDQYTLEHILEGNHLGMVA